MVVGLSIVLYRYHEADKTKIIDYIYYILANYYELNKVLYTNSLILHCSDHKTLM